VTVPSGTAPLPVREPHGATDVPLRRGAGEALAAGVATLGGRDVVLASSRPTPTSGALTAADGETLAEAARLALRSRLPLVALLATSGADVGEGVDALCGWGRAARSLAACSGVVPVLAAVVGPVVSGPALLLGLADVVVMTPRACAFVSGPAMVETFTGVRLDHAALGGTPVHGRKTGVAALLAEDADDALDLLAEVLGYLPSHTDAAPPLRPSSDPTDRLEPSLRAAVPASASGSYDVRRVLAAVVDDGEMVELSPWWAPQIVTALASVGGRPVGVVANQPQTLAGTLDIAASEKGARFVRFCDAFNLPILTFVDTPGFLPGKDLEWRGMIRHGAKLVFAYAEAAVPRVCVILRKAYGGAYIVMDSKGLGNDVCLAWPTAEIAVMGAEGATRILARGADEAERAELERRYRTELLTPFVAAERGYVDAVIDPAATRGAIAAALGAIATKRERLAPRKHENLPV
jgi:acetyl-CoA carboxylase carboxyltransferase component